MVKDFLVAVAADAGGRVFNVVVEAKGQLANNNRTGDVAGCDNGVQFAIDAFVTRVGSVSNNGKCVDKVIEEADTVKRGYYAKQCTDSGVLFFTFDIFFFVNKNTATTLSSQYLKHAEVSSHKNRIYFYIREEL